VSQEISESKMNEKQNEMEEGKIKEDQFETNPKERCKRRIELEEKIEKLIIESNVNFEDATNVLSRMLVIYRDKGKNLLNVISIQKVIETPRFIP